MVAYILSIAVGLGVGIAYGLLGIRSPAPPIIALLGLLGMLAGEAAVGWLRGHPQLIGWMCHGKSFSAAAPSQPQHVSWDRPSRADAPSSSSGIHIQHGDDVRMTTLPDCPPQPVPAEVQLVILELIGRMNQLLDDEDYEGYLACYADDAAFDPGLAPPVTGKAAIRAFLHQGQASGFIVGKRHVPSNIVLRQSGPTVTARFYLTVFERAAAPAVVATALITDSFGQRGDVWLATSHTTRIDPGFLAMMGRPA